MANVVTVQKKSKSKWDFHHNAKPKWLPWTNSKPRPNKPSSMLWTHNNCTKEIKWMPISEPNKDNMPRKYGENSRKRLYNHKLGTIKQLYSHKYVPTTIVTPSVRKKTKEIWLLQRRKMRKIFLLVNYSKCQWTSNQPSGH